MKTKTTLLASCITLYFALFSINANAQVPGVSCLTAVQLSLDSCSGAQNIDDFTLDPGSPAICSPGVFRREGWYYFVAPGGIAITVEAITTTTTANLEIQVISGTCGVGTETQIACVNNNTASSCQYEVAALGVLAAGTYYIRILNVGAAVNMTNTNVCLYATPVNDDCAGAIIITPAPASANCNITTSGTIAGATQTMPAGTCGAIGAANDDVWYTFMATSTTQIITVTPCAGFNAVFEVFSTACGGTGTSINCTNASGIGITETATITGLTIGNQYWIRVYDNGANCNSIPSCSTFTICIQTPPANDNCVGAIPLSTNSTCIYTTGDVNVATNSGIPACGSGASNPDDDVWYSFVATCSCQTITVTGSASFDPSFEVFSGTCGSLTSISCNAPGGIPGASVSNSLCGLTIGTTYYIRVYDYGVAPAATTSFDICIVNAPPVNDNCVGAIALATPSATCNPTNGDVCGATQSLAGCSGNANDDLWYSFVAQQAIENITVVGSASFDAVFELFASCGGASLGCINATGTGGTESASFSGLSAGVTYYIRVYDAGAGFPATTTFTICVTSPPLNDDCPGTTLGVSSTPLCTTLAVGTVFGATPSGFAATCGGTPNDDVWYNFIATSSSHIVTVVPCATFDPVIQAYDNSCGTGGTIGCMNSLGQGGTETLTLTGLLVGTTYWVRVYDFTGSSACSTFTICITTPATVGITTQNTQPTITIAPNPFTSQTTISFSEIQKHTIITIADVLGKQVFHAVIIGTDNFVFPKGDLPKGIYFISLEDVNKNTANRKLVIE